MKKKIKFGIAPYIDQNQSSWRSKLQTVQRENKLKKNDEDRNHTF
jgi:hypothetical protein